MHLVHLIARLNDGGPARVLQSLGRMAVASGWQVTVLSGTVGPGEPDWSDRLRTAGLTVLNVPGLGRRLHPADDLQAVVQVLRQLHRLRPDLVHTHTAKAGALGRVVCRLLGLPCLHTYHGHVLHGYFGPGGSRLATLAERLLAEDCHLHALGPDQVAELRDRYRIGRPGFWHDLPVPVEAVPPAPASWHAGLIPGRPVLTYLGRLEPVKDPRLFLSVLTRLARQRPVQGLICGTGSLRPQVEGWARTLSVPILFPGQVPAGEALAVTDLLLLTSRNEGQPLSLVEAALAGLPVVAPAVGGLPYLGRAGLAHIVPRSCASLTAACHTHVVDGRSELIRERAACFLPERLWPAWQRLYRQVVGR